MTVLEEIQNELDKEIQVYEELDTLYDAKREALINHKRENLIEVDVKIIETLERAKEISQNRATLSDNACMSALIEKAKSQNSEKAQVFVEQQKKIQTLTKSLSFKEQNNLDLIKNAMNLVAKTFQTYISVLAPHPDRYNAKGKMDENHEDIQLSSIIEEA